MDELLVLNQKIFVFCRQFKCTENDNNILDVLNQMKENYDIELQNDWTKFWSVNGEQVVAEDWRNKYEEYLAGDSETVDLEQQRCAENIIPNKYEIKTDSWQVLWENHMIEIYEEYYKSYFDAFWSYYCFLNEYTTIIEEQNDDNITSDEFMSMKFLGLPTAFATSKYTCKIQENSMEHFEHNTSDSLNLKEEQINEICDEEKKRDKTIKKRSNRKLRKLPAFMREDKNMLKYWRKRFSLFSRFDEGIQLDRESWFSVTPEKVACHMAQRLSCDLLIDGFCGCGGNAIQFAKVARHVIAIDIDESKIHMARQNAAIYGVTHKIDFIVGDFLQICATEQLTADIVFLSPPWGGPNYKKMKTYDIEKFLLPISASELIDKTRKISSNIALFLPRNANIQQVIKLAGVGKNCEIEHNFLDDRLVGITALYGCKIIST